MPSSTPYISFPRNAAEAMPYYQEIFGGTLDLMTYGDNPMEGMPFTPRPRRSRMPSCRAACSPSPAGTTSATARCRWTAPPTRSW